jgi:hypothetical protein
MPGVKSVSGFISAWDYPGFSDHLWEQLSSLYWLYLLLCQRSADCFCVGLFWALSPVLLIYLYILFLNDIYISLAKID